MHLKGEDLSAYFDDELSYEGSEVNESDLNQIQELSQSLQLLTPQEETLLAKKDLIKSNILSAFEKRSSKKLFKKNIQIPWPMAAAAAFLLVGASLFSGYFFGDQMARSYLAAQNQTQESENPNLSSEPIPAVEVSIPGQFTFTIQGQDELVRMTSFDGSDGP